MRLTRFALCALALALVAPSLAEAADIDHDGVDAGDCKPLDPAVAPGKPDKPDLAFEDTNCDGIDGDQSKAVFVSVLGDDAASGSKGNPKRTVTAGVAAAEAAGKDVYIAGGTYQTEPVGGVPLADSVGLYGGYTPFSGVRSASEVTTIKGSPQAVLAVGDQGVVLQLLTLEGTPSLGNLSLYGLRAIPNGAEPSRIAMRNVVSKGAAAAAGSNGSNGTTGTPGSTGNNGSGACVAGLTKFGAGGSGGAGGAGGNNSVGANGSTGGGVLGGLGGGLLGTILGIGNNGSPGADGATGPSNTLAFPDGASWPASFAASGTSGGPGGGGGGGRGGTGDNNFGIGICGGGGGSGGTGGGGGGSGGAGQNGGGSFGVYLLNSSVVAMTSTLTGGNGGAGGNGGTGAFGGGGGGRGLGGPGDCLTVFVTVCGGSGANGGIGGSGGRGGGGGAGVGGPSFGVYQAGTGSGFASRSGTTTTSGTAGQGGLQGNTGALAANGESSGVKRSASAPATSTADFDGDGVNDSADACPETAGSSNGCPVRPAKVSPPPPAGTSPAPADTASPTWTLSVAKAQRSLKTKAIKFGMKPSEGCTLSVTAKLKTKKLGTLKKALVGGVKKGLSVKLTKKGLRALKKALRTKKKVTATLSLKAVDGAGNVATSKRKVVLKR
jgi:hypothetical protein